MHPWHEQQPSTSGNCTSSIGQLPCSGQWTTERTISKYEVRPYYVGSKSGRTVAYRAEQTTATMYGNEVRQQRIIKCPTLNKNKENNVFKDGIGV